MLARDVLQFAQKFRRRGNVSALALYRLNENCGDVAGIHETLEKFILNEVDAMFRSDAELGVRIWRVENAGNQRQTESLAAELLLTPVTKARPWCVPWKHIRRRR